MPRKISPDLARKLIAHSVMSLWDTPAAARLVPPIMLWGPPGVGKSAIVHDVAGQLDVPVIDVRLAQREPVDMRGLPVPEGDSVRWLVASEWPRDPDSRGIIFFDELTAADRTLQAAAYELILDRKLGDLYRVPDGWYIAAAGNRTSDRAVAVPMSSALANRFCHLNIEADSRDWLKWGRRAGLHHAVLGFIAYRPELLFDMGRDSQQGWPSPRTWERVSFVLTQAQRDDGPSLPQDMLDAQVEGLIGEAAAIEFRAFAGIADVGPTAHDILIHDRPCRFPRRADQRHALVSALVHVLVKARDPLALWPRFLAVAEEMPSDFATFAVNEALAALPGDTLDRYLGHQAMGRWSTVHGNALAVHHGAAAGTDAFAKHLDLDALIAENS